MQAGSDLSTICLRGTSALHHAAEANRTENIAALLKRANGALVQATDEMGWTALHYAVLHQLPESAALLIQACCHPGLCLTCHRLCLNTIVRWLRQRQCRIV